MERCGLCDSDQAEFVKSENGYSALFCQVCGLIYTSPKPSLHEVRDMYEKDESASVTIDAQIKLRYKKFLVAKQDVSEIQSLVYSGRLLDVGCGAGYFLDVAKNKGFACTGVEINEVLVEYAINTLGLDILHGTLSELEISPETYDVAYLRYVLSHMHNPVREFEKINNALTNQGLIFFETGNLPDLSIKSIRKMELGLPDHLYFFSQENVNTLLEKTGFDLIYSKIYSMSAHEGVRKVFERKIRNIVQNSDRSQMEYQATRNEIIAAWISYVLTYKLGRFLPKSGRFCTIKYLAKKK